MEILNFTLIGTRPVFATCHTYCHITSNLIITT